MIRLTELARRTGMAMLYAAVIAAMAWMAMFLEDVGARR